MSLGDWFGVGLISVDDEAEMERKLEGIVILFSDYCLAALSRKVRANR